jgi:lipid-binding SYLF domain-containing protein
MNAEILTYSRAKGLFAGVSLEGSTLRQDSGANEKLFGQKVTAKEIILEGKVGTPAAGSALANLLQEKSPKNLSN